MQQRFQLLAHHFEPVKSFTVKCAAVQEIASSSATEPREDANSLPSDRKRELVQRVIKGQAFNRSPAMCAFLLYITEHAITGRPERLKEQTIGVEVLGRKPNYNPAEDNIVRVRAHELRGRLEKYFASEGIAEPIIITIPKGSYIPEFIPRRAILPETPAVLPATEKLSTGTPEIPPIRQYGVQLALILLVTILASVALTRYVLKNDSRTSLTPPGGAIRDFWGQFFTKPGEELQIVYADTNFALWQDMNGKTLDLGAYLSHKYLQDQEDKLREVATRRSTSPADITVSVHLAVLTEEFGGRVNAQFARNANAELFHHGNLVLIGSHRSNPWVEMYEPSLNFVLEQDPHSGAPLFRNRAPQTHESSIYGIPEMLDINGDEQKEFTSYGLIALMKGCGERGLTVLDEGLNMQATQAVGDLITDPLRLEALLRSIGHKPGTSVTPFEALIQITSLPGGYDNPKVIAFRLRPTESCTGG